MDWDPAKYNEFQKERFAPFDDLLKLVNIRAKISVLDLGCGTGELTNRILSLLPDSTILGIDSSVEMLTKSTPFTNDQLSFQQQSIGEILHSGQYWDLIISNAALQWVETHETLVPAIINCLNPGGQILIQVPAQQHNLLNIMLSELAAEMPFRKFFTDWNRRSPILDIDHYAAILYKNGGNNITVFEKIYPLIAENTNSLYDWVSGTALIPYLERLEPREKEKFTGEFISRLAMRFSERPVFYPFRRIIMSAIFN